MFSIIRNEPKLCKKALNKTVIFFSKIAVQFLSNKLSKITFTKSQQPYDSLSPTNSDFVQSSNKKSQCKTKRKISTGSYINARTGVNDRERLNERKKLNCLNLFHIISLFLFRKKT